MNLICKKLRRKKKNVNRMNLIRKKLCCEKEIVDLAWVRDRCETNREVTLMFAVGLGGAISLISMDIFAICTVEISTFKDLALTLIILTAAILVFSRTRFNKIDQMARKPGTQKENLGTRIFHAEFLEDLAAWYLIVIGGLFLIAIAKINSIIYMMEHFFSLFSFVVIFIAPIYFFLFKYPLYSTETKDGLDQADEGKNDT